MELQFRRNGDFEAYLRNVGAREMHERQARVKSGDRTCAIALDRERQLVTVSSRSVTKHRQALRHGHFLLDRYARVDWVGGNVTNNYRTARSAEATRAFLRAADEQKRRAEREQAQWDRGEPAWEEDDEEQQQVREDDDAEQLAHGPQPAPEEKEAAGQQAYELELDGVGKVVFDRQVLLKALKEHAQMGLVTCGAAQIVHQNMFAQDDRVVMLTPVAVAKILSHAVREEGMTDDLAEDVDAELVSFVARNEWAQASAMIFLIPGTGGQPLGLCFVVNSRRGDDDDPGGFQLLQSAG